MQEYACHNLKDDCKAYRAGNCSALSDTNFKHGCPFYKTQATFDKEVQTLIAHGHSVCMRETDYSCYMNRK